MVTSTARLAVAVLLRLLASQLIFFFDPHGYRIIDSGGRATGSAYLDLKNGDLIWRLARARGETTLELRLDRHREYPVYSTDVLKRWVTNERDDSAALMTDEIAVWLRDHLGEIEHALEVRRAETLAEWELLKHQRSNEIFE